MASVSQLVEAVSTVTMTERKTVNAYARALIDAGVLPKSRGRAIAHVNGEHVAKLVLAIALKSTIADAAEMVDMYSDFEADTSEGTVKVIDMLADLLRAASAGGLGEDAAWNEVSVRVLSSHPGVDVHLPRVGSAPAKLIRFRMENALPGLLAGAITASSTFFSRSANISFGGLVFICQIMGAYQPEATPQGSEVVERLLRIAAYRPETGE